MSLEDKINPYPLLLPDSLVLGQLVAAMGVFIKATAWEIGERFDAILSHRHDPNWLVTEFGDYRTPNLYDPDFIFDWHPQNSILWEALPPFSYDLQKRFGRVRWTRNRWEHEAALQNINSFLNGTDQIKRLAEPLGVRTLAYATLLVERTKTLQKSGGVLPPTDLELQIQREKEVAEEAQRDAEQALSVADAALAKAAELGAQATQASEAKRGAMVELAKAQADIHQLELKLGDAGKISRQSVTEPADDLEPGTLWEGIPLGIRILTLKANMVDLMDRTTQTLLSQQIGQVATEGARRWLELMPTGGIVHLTPAGHAAGEVGGRYVYLGRLDAEI